MVGMARVTEGYSPEASSGIGCESASRLTPVRRGPVRCGPRLPDVLIAGLRRIEEHGGTPSRSIERDATARVLEAPTRAFRMRSVAD